MAGEIQFSFASLKTTYVLIRNRIGQVWNTANSAFETYVTALYVDYTITCTEQGTASGYYTGTFPPAIGPGAYSLVAKQQIAGGALESDPAVAVGDLQWNGTTLLPLSDMATSGQLGQIGPIRLARGTMIQNFQFKLVSSLDHVSPFVSGIISGQIMRDNGNFGPLQSGAFTEVGLGWYRVQALTSGDLNANTVALVFNGVGISGGTSDQRDYGFILQRVSGY